MLEIILLLGALLLCVFTLIEYLQNKPKTGGSNSGEDIVDPVTTVKPAVLSLLNSELPADENLHGLYDAVIINNVNEKFPKEYIYTDDNGTKFTVNLTEPLYPLETRMIKVHIDGTLQEGIYEIPLFLDN